MMKNKEIFQYYINEVLVEGKVDDLKAKYADKIRGEIFDKIVAIDPTKQKKYLPWILKVLSQEGVNDSNMDQLRETDYGPGLIKAFDRLLTMNKLQGADRDIFTYKTIEALYDKVKHYIDLSAGYDAIKSKNKEEKEKKEEGSKTVFENDLIKVVWTSKKCASDIYGAGTKWCIAATNPAYQGYFDKYMLGDKKNIYMFIFKPAALKKYPKLDSMNLNKVAFLLGKDHSTDTMWDEEDNEFYTGGKKKNTAKYQLFYNTLKDINPELVIKMEKSVEQFEQKIEIPKMKFSFKPRIDLTNI